MKILIVISLLASLVFLYGLAENRLMLITRHESFGGNIKIVQISDLHRKKFGEGNKRLAERVRRENPDLIFITGDITSRKCVEFSATDAFLSGIKDTAPIYMIFGNHEKDLEGEILKDFLSVLERNGVKILKNTYETVNIKGRELKIYGLDEPYTVYKKDGHYRNLDVIDEKNMEQMLGKCPEGENLLLAHNPLFADKYAEWGADYTFSGHVHGGLVRLFGIAVLSPERKFFPKYSKGIYSFGGKKVLVSGGLGKMRLFNPPEIVVYKL